MSYVQGGEIMDGVAATSLIQLLSELVERHGADLEVAVAVTVSGRPLRQYLQAVAVDSEIRDADEPPLSSPPTVWLIADAPPAGLDPFAPRRASTAPIDQDAPATPPRS